MDKRQLKKESKRKQRKKMKESHSIVLTYLEWNVSGSWLMYIGWWWWWW